MESKNIRNIAIIAHVDHGKTTLVDELLKGSGMFRDNQQVADRMMDSMDLEKEKGITIKAKNTAVVWQEHTINIVDTPGHADFGAEVERVMKMVDGVLLVVDAYEGPQAQTRFVLKKALQHGLAPVVVVNKVDREHSDPEAVHDKVLELFLELDATEDQFNCPFLYGSAKNGWCDRSLEGPRKDMTALFETVLEKVPAPTVEEGQPFRMLVSNIDWNDFVGRIAIGRLLSGEVRMGETIYSLRRNGSTQRVKITRLFSYTGLTTSDSIVGVAGDIVGLSGFDEIDIGDTLAASPEAERLPFVEIDPPTIQMEFAVNDGPMAGRDGKLVTSRQIRERLLREMKTNISIKVDETGKGTNFLVSARGAMQIAVLVETMRREGYEVLVSRPTVIFKEVDGARHEPFEKLWVELQEELLGTIMENLSKRKGVVTNILHHKGGVTIEAEVPTRGLIGFESDLVTVTSGHGVMSHLFLEYRPYAGDIVTRQAGTLVSIEQGKVMAYALDTLQDRGKLFVAPGDEVYNGQIVGENPRKHDMPVNPCKAKQLDNIRSSGDGKGIMLSPPVKFSLERAIEYIAPDEFVEATPHHLRLRKRIMDANERRKAEKRLDPR
jgi:GTP-binding protein